MIGATDVSGFSDGRGQHKVISIVIGSEEDIFQLHNKIGIKKIHMKLHTSSKRNLIKKRLVFKSSKILAISLVVGKNRIVHEVYNKYKVKKQFASIGTIYTTFDQILLDMIRPRMEQFLSRSNLKLSDISFQCDSDMSKTLQNWKLDCIKPGKIHEIADALAYFCKSGHSVPHSTKHDFELDLETKMKKKFLA